MKAVIALLALVAAANAGVVAPVVAQTAFAAPTIISRAPAFDSAVIKSDRLGGNFAYSVAENHAYAAHTPIVQTVASPVAVSYAAAPAATVVGSPLAYSAYPYGYAGLPLGYSGLINNGLIGGQVLAAAPAATVIKA